MNSQRVAAAFDIFFSGASGKMGMFLRHHIALELVQHVRSRFCWNVLECGL
jgi:hypothetical protein